MRKSPTGATPTSVMRKPPEVAVETPRHMSAMNATRQMTVPSVSLNSSGRPSFSRRQTTTHTAMVMRKNANSSAPAWCAPTLTRMSSMFRSSEARSSVMRLPYEARANVRDSILFVLDQQPENLGERRLGGGVDLRRPAGEGVAERLGRRGRRADAHDAAAGGQAGPRGERRKRVGRRGVRRRQPREGFHHPVEAASAARFDAEDANPRPALGRPRSRRVAPSSFVSSW